MKKGLFFLALIGMLLPPLMGGKSVYASTGVCSDLSSVETVLTALENKDSTFNRDTTHWAFVLKSSTPYLVYSNTAGNLEFANESTANRVKSNLTHYNFYEPNTDFKSENWTQYVNLTCVYAYNNLPINANYTGTLPDEYSSNSTPNFNNLLDIVQEDPPYTYLLPTDGERCREEDRPKIEKWKDALFTDGGNNPYNRENFLDAKLKFEEAIHNGYYAVSYSRLPSENGQSIQITFTDNKDGSTYFYSDGTTMSVWTKNTTSLNRIIINIYSESMNKGTSSTTYNCKWAYNTMFSGTNATPIANESSLNLLFSTFPHEYPVDYTGQPIRADNADGSGSGIADFVPNFYVSEIKDFKATFYDMNFYNYDSTPFACSDGFPPRISYEMRDGTTLLESGKFASNSLLEYQFEKIPEDKSYTFWGKYECTSGSPIFNKDTTVQIEHNAIGSAKIDDLLTTCMSSEFPFIHFQACMENLGKVFAVLSFNNVSFANSWAFTEQCHNLSTLDDWLNLENSTVCPQVSAEVRNTVTPFITFLLGLVTVYFVIHIRNRELS